MDDIPKDKLQEVVDDLPNKCLVCGGKPDRFGVYIPDKDSSYNTENITFSTGKQRHICYKICSNCAPMSSKDEDKIKAVEKVIEDRMWEEH